MFHHMDPHLKKQSEFGVPGNTVKVERETYVGCIVIGAPPHTSCPMYTLTKAMAEKQYRKRLIKTGEFGTRDNTIQRLGFQFHDVRKQKIKKLEVKEDGELKRMAFGWSVGTPSAEKEEENRKSREEGEKLAFKRSNQCSYKKTENQIKNIKQKTEDKILKTSEHKKGESRFKTHLNEVSCKQCNRQNVHMCEEDAENKLPTRRGGWPHHGGLRGGAPAATSSNVSSSKHIVRVCLCLRDYECVVLIQQLHNICWRN